MSLYKELDHTDKVREITGVQFSVMSPEEMSHKQFYMIQMVIQLLEVFLIQEWEFLIMEKYVQQIV